MAGAKHYVVLALMPSSLFFKEARAKQFARRIFKSTRCHLRSFSMHPSTVHQRQTLLRVSGRILKFRSSEKYFIQHFEGWLVVIFFELHLGVYNNQDQLRK